MGDKQERIKEKLADELENEPDEAFSTEQLVRITGIVSEYNRKIKCHLAGVQEKRTSWADRLADRVASFGGSWSFIILFTALLVVWMIWNILGWKLRFDEPPFILLNLILSCISAFQAPFILMSQNRQAARDKQEALLDFAINYKAQQENLDMMEHLKRIEQLLESHRRNTP